MNLFDLKKRRQARREATPEPPTELVKVIPAVNAMNALAAASGEALELLPAAELGVVAELTPLAPKRWEPDAQQTALEVVPRGQDVLVLGLGPFDQAWPEALLGRARGVVAVDPDKARLATVRGYCHRTIDSPLDSYEWLTRLGSQRFSVALMSDALTHLADPSRFLREVRGLLTPDGVVVAMVPNVAHGDQRLNLLAGEYPRQFEPGAPLHQYSRDRLRELFAFSGFGLVDVQVYRSPLFGAGSGLVPELFPESVLAALGAQDDLDAAYLIVKAQPQPADVLLRTLFDEQSQLRLAVRNELARSHRTHDALTQRAKEADARHEALAKELEEAKKSQASLSELAQRAEQNVRRLSKDVDDTHRELRAVRSSFAYRFADFFKPKAKVLDTGTANELSPFKYEPEPKSRY